MSSNKDFSPSSSPISLLYAPSRLKESFSFSWWTVTSLHSKNVLQLSYWKPNVRGTSRHIVYFRYKKRWHSASPGRVVLGLPSPFPRVCTDRRTDGHTYAEFRTKIFRINRLPNLLTHGAPRATLLHTAQVHSQKILHYLISGNALTPDDRCFFRNWIGNVIPSLSGHSKRRKSELLSSCALVFKRSWARENFIHLCGLYTKIIFLPLNKSLTYCTDRVSAQIVRVV